MNDLYWEINEVGTKDYTLNIFVEVPTYARRMIWNDGCKYDGGAVSTACAPLDPDGDPGVPEGVQRWFPSC